VVVVRKVKWRELCLTHLADLGVFLDVTCYLGLAVGDAVHKSLERGRV
jgi:hypothetical protein